jgi:hypothetical protein
MCAPLLLLLFIGTLEILMLYRTEAKLNALAANFAEMVSDQEITTGSGSLTQTHSPIATTGSGSVPGLADLCAGAVDGLQPLPANGLTIAVASVTETKAAQAATQGSPATAAAYDEWEADFSSACSPLGTQSIGINGSSGARTLAVGSGSGNAMVQAVGDNIIIVRASLQYTGLLGLVLSSAQTLSQTAVARWRYASATNITNIAATPAPASTLELSCSGTGCISNNGV